MEVPRSLSNLVAYANSVDQGNSERIFTLSATLVTPTEQISLIIPTGLAKLAKFDTNVSDDGRLKGQIQPGVYQNQIIPYKDNLHVEVVKRVGYQQTMTRYRCIPLGTPDNAMQANNTSLADLSTKDSINMVTVTFQLMDPGYAVLRNELVADNFLMATLPDVLHNLLVRSKSKIKFTDADAWKGVDIELPCDNTRVFKQVIVNPPIPLVRLAYWIQENDQFGFYSKGLGCYYRKGMWYVYPLMKIGRYETASKVANIYLLPENVFPTLKNTWFWEGNVLTILSTGGIASTDDSGDIDKQNSGAGKRIVNADAIMGEVGNYYSKGQALTTRKDSVSEYKTSNRASGEELVLFDSKPSNNLCKHLTQNAYKEGTTLNRTWHNSDIDQITPAMPCRVFYMEGERMMYREGTILSVRGETQADTQSVSPKFREHAALQMFISNQTEELTS